MSIARHHAEWLSLVPVSGPFLSLPVLMEAFNTGLEPHDPDLHRLLRQEYGSWQEATEKRKSDPAPQHQWIKVVLNSVLELDDRVLAEGQAISQSLQAEIPEHHELLRPSIVVIDPTTKKPRLLVQTYPRSQSLTSYVANSQWKASPDTRMTELLHATGVRLGLVTNGEHWMLVDAPKGETTGYASWYASLWLEEHITLQAFRSLLSASRFFNVPDDQTLEALLTKSASNQQEVTDQLGYQVRRAVEVLIHSLDRADQDFGRELLADVREEALYESALTVMMRLVFLFCAEERELIPSKPFPVYEQNYSVSTISKQLRELADQNGEELLERRYDAWPRLLAAFRAVYGGLQHDDVHIPAYGGSLFDPDRFPFLEGRKKGTSWKDAEANPLPVNNRTVLHLLEALQFLQIRVPGGGPAEARRLSFRALDIEQIGHVYEGLLDHTAKRAAEPFLGLIGTRDKEPEFSLAELEKLHAKGEADLVKFLKEETGKSDSALKKLLKPDLDTAEVARFRTACQSDDALWKRMKPFAGLVRADSFGYPVVIPQGSVFVTAGTDRRSSGTHYTPRSLTEPIVQYTLEPLVYVGPTEGKPKSEWKLKSARELLELKICDMACGSGAFLVQAARYMAERLLEAWDAIQRQSQPGVQQGLYDEAIRGNDNVVRITPFGEPSKGGLFETVVPLDPDERKIYAMRIIAQRCLYGVDKNPLAAEMAKLSLWLLTLAKDKPFEFLDHSIRSGDSLVGLHSIDQLRHFSLKPDADDAVLFKGPLDSAVDEAITLRLKLEDMPANTVEDVQRQERLLIEANEKIVRLRCAADMLVAGEFWGDSGKDKLERVRHAAVVSGHYVEKGPTDEFEQAASKERRGQTMFHWPLEFPEVIVKRNGFHAFVGNPPFLGGKRIAPTLGDQYQSHLKMTICPEKGAADICVYFLTRAQNLCLQSNGQVGLVQTNTVAQGDTREVGLVTLLSKGCTITNATQSMKWPAAGAALEVAVIVLHTGAWSGECLLGGRVVDEITSYLSSQEQLGPPERLAQNQGLSFIGVTLLGDGFLLTPEMADRFIEGDPKCKEIIRPFLNGKDFNSSPSYAASRLVPDFGDMPEDSASRYTDLFEHLRNTVGVQRARLHRQIHEDCFWKFWDKRKALQERIKDRTEVIVRALTSKHFAFDVVPTTFVIDQTLLIFPDLELFPFLQSSIHEVWSLHHGATLENRPRYSLSDCFQPFPFPGGGPDDDEFLAAATSLNRMAATYRETRIRLMTENKEGLTKIYNRFHDRDESSADMQSLRNLHVEMDSAVAAAYGWSDLALAHGFHETKQGVLFTISESARREVLQRLLKLNHERYDEEVKQGLHGKKGATKKAAPKKKAASKSVKQEASLFGGEDDE